MRRFRIAIVVVVVLAVVGAVIVVVHVEGDSKKSAPSAATPPGGAVAVVPSHPTGSYVLTASNMGSTYAPTFTGNGEIGVRVPPTGQGYAAGPVVPSDSEVAGFYAQPPGGVQVRANIPTWSTLGFFDAGHAFSLAQGVTRDWRQSIDFRTGVITTSASWTSPAGHVTDLTYEVSTDRARADVGLVRLVLTPRWSGPATVIDEIDGVPATLSAAVAKDTTLATHDDSVLVRATGTNVEAAIASHLTTSANVNAATQSVDLPNPQSVGEQLTFPVVSGQQYTLTKYVGVDTSRGTGDILALARQDARAAAGDTYAALRKENDTAWATLWSGRIDVLGNPALATAVNASEFYLWSSVRDGVDWSVSPAGLSSNGYNGHIFWDAETWMYPALLAQHPDLAATMNTYRSDRLAAAAAHAAATGARGVRFPWESALDGTEQIPPPVSVFSEGLYEQHITADVAIAQWQYYLATGDRQWLAAQGWPVISGAAQFWASRVELGADGRYHLSGMTGPDEYNENVDDEAYTNAAAVTTLQDATQAAAALGERAPAAWSQIASKIMVGTGAGGVVPEYSTYRGQLVKQADVTMLEYPLGYPLAAGAARADIDYYAPRTDPNGPSMTDAINAIDTAALATPGCASSVYMQRSEAPFVRDVFDQFSETRTGGAFTFMTGIGGFLQEFLYGVSGLRWNADAVQLAPSLSGGIGGVVLDGLSWHGRRFTVAVGDRSTTVSLESGAALPVQDGTTVHDVAVGHPLTLATARPDLAATSDLVRCATASATSSQLAAPARAAVDGSVATGWQPITLPASITVAVAGGARSLTGVTLAWGRQWPAVVALNQPPAPGPIVTLRPSSYTIAVSADGKTWRTVATVSGRGAATSDVVHFPAVRARFVSVRITSATGGSLPLLDELTAAT